MGRFRRFVKKALKPFIMAGVAGTVAVSLVVTTPSNAQAFVPPPVLPAVFGATQMVLPELMATGSVLGPVGWGIAAVGALGIGLYATKDYWLPYVVGKFGQPQNTAPAVRDTSDGGPVPSPSPTASTSPSPSPSPTSTFAGSQIVDENGLLRGYLVTDAKQTGNSIAVSYSYKGYGSNTTPGFTQQMGLIAECTDRASGKKFYQVTNVTRTRSNFNSFVDSNTFNMCDGTADVTGFVAGGGGGQATSPPNLHPQWGGKLGDAFFDGSNYADSGQHGTQQNWNSGSFLPGAKDPRTDKTKYTTTVECIAQDGTRATISADSLGGAGGLTVPSCAAAGLGHATGNISVDGFLDGSPVKTPLWNATPPTPDPSRPLCDSNRPGEGCKLAVKLDNQECVMGLFACVNWAELSKDPNWTPRYSCEYGPYVVALAVCSPLEKGYQPGGAPATNPNTDGDPKTGDNTGPDGKPDPGPGQTPTTTGTPGAGGQPDPNADPKGKECFPSGWGVFNPLEWVMKPVGCALTAAFVPTNTVVQAQTTRIQDKIKNAGPGKVIAAWQTTFNGVGGGSGCAGPPVTFSMEGYAQTMRPFDACSGGMATAASISFAVSSVMIVIFGGLGIARAASSAFGFNLGFGKGSTE